MGLDVNFRMIKVKEIKKMWRTPACVATTVSVNSNFPCIFSLELVI